MSALAPAAAGTLLSRVPMGQSDAAVLLGTPLVSADVCGGC
jgi:hypothetical protein